jgi:redox-sensitive bicupin YhaK (pirin superfamily)
MTTATITVRRSGDRGHFDHGWLNTYHTFSFGQYYDPEHMGFRSLRVINEDFVRAGRGFAPHPHDNMEIITYILEGEIAHKDSTGTSGVIRPGEVQRMSAGSGIVHSEANPSTANRVHLLQIWIEPNEQDVAPEYEQRVLTKTDGKPTLVASSDGEAGSMRIHADARLFAGTLAQGKDMHIDLKHGNGWVQVARGSVRLGDITLRAGDGAAIENASAIDLQAVEPAELLIFDLA